MEAEKKGFLVLASPWKDAPFKISGVVVTDEGKDHAIQIFKGYCRNETVIIEEATPVTVLVEGNGKPKSSLS